MRKQSQFYHHLVHGSNSIFFLLRLLTLLRVKSHDNLDYANASRLGGRIARESHKESMSNKSLIKMS